MAAEASQPETVSALAEALQRIGHLDRDMARTRGVLREATRARDIAAERLRAERLDVQRLEDGLLGRLRQRTQASLLERERHEAEEAATAYQQADDAVRALTDELAHLQQVRGQLGDPVALRRAHDVAFAMRLDALAGTPGAGDRLGHLLKAQAAAHTRAKELAEAVDAAAAARTDVDGVRASLEAARSWGKGDLLVGGLLVSAAKHAHLDEAQRTASRASQSLARLNHELADTGLRLQASADLNVTALTRWADLWFDNIFTDFAIQSRIKDAQAAVEDCRDEVSRLLIRLRQEHTAAAREAADADHAVVALVRGHP